MMLKDLIKSNYWLSIELVFSHLYPNQVNNLDAYENVFDELKTLTPIYSEITINVSNETDLFDNESYVDISGYDHSKTSQSVNDINDSLALEFTSWNKWLGMKIDQNSLINFTPLEIICHCLHEMTIMGFSQKEIESELDKIKDTAEEIRQMTEDDKKEKLISFNDLDQLFDFKDYKSAN